MKDLLSSIETEYGFAAWDNAGKRMPLTEISDAFLQALETEQPWLPATDGGWFLGNGARLYWDAGEHPEYATPECAGHPRLLVAHVRAGHQILNRIMKRVQHSQRIRETRLWRGNIDYLTKVSWGCHENYLTQHATEWLAPDLIPHLVSRVVYGGAGGFSPDEHTRFSLSPRLELFQLESTSDTMDLRGIINTRSEHHARVHRRLHLICRDSLASQTADLLSIGMTRLVVALADTHVLRPRRLEIEDSVAALHAFCRDPTCRERVRTSSGRYSAIDIQHHYLEAIDAHAAELPDWTAEITTLCSEVLRRLAAEPRDLAGVLDWPTKKLLFEESCGRSARELLIADRLMSELNSPLDRYYRAAGKPDLGPVVVTRAEIEDAVENAPSMTRAKVRGEVIKRFTGRLDAHCNWARLVMNDRYLLMPEPWESQERWVDMRPPDPDIPAFLRHRARQRSTDRGGDPGP